jgi:hypothetical protein
MTVTDLKELSPFAALIAVVYLLGSQLIRNWRETERERTAATTETFQAIAAGLTTLAGKIDAHHRADIESHGEMAMGLARIEKGVDVAHERAERMDLKTPPNGVQSTRAPTHTGDR